jgi:aminocarboxymuconate-semialdehyde decarboxylase
LIADVHNHVLPTPALEWLRREGRAVGVRVDREQVIAHAEGFQWPIADNFTDPDLVIKGLVSRGIDVAIISIPPPLLFHEADPGAAGEFVDVVNGGLLSVAEAHPERFRVLGSVLLQDPYEAKAGVSELIANELCAGVQVGTSLSGPALHDPALSGFWDALAASDLLAMVHPVYVGPIPGLEDRYLTNVVGNPMLTTAVAMRMIDCRMLEREPPPRVLLAHAGGFLPYQIGRLAHASDVRPELHVSEAKVRQQLSRFLYDTITHDSRALRFLLDTVGSDRVLLGTDAPFDMADREPLETIWDASPSAFDDVTANNAARLLGDRWLANAKGDADVKA